MFDFPFPDATEELQRLQFEANRNFQELQQSVSSPHVISAISSDAYKCAGYSCQVIMEQIKKFEDNLDDDHEVAVKLASFGQSITLSVTGIGYSNPDTLVFYGYVGDQPAILIQHMSQLNFLLVATQKAFPEKPPRRIGFAVPNED